MAERMVHIDGIDYYTLIERPQSSDQPARYVLLCHALMSNLHMYEHTVQTLNHAGYTTIRFDHIGHHKTPNPSHSEASYHMDDITKHMHQIVQGTTGQSRVKAVIGCSIGGVLALRYAMLYPEGVESVISIAAPGITSPEAAKTLWSQRIEQFEADQNTGEDVLCHATVNRWFPGSNPEDDPIRAESLKHVRTCSLRGYTMLADTIRNYDYADEVREIRDVGVLIVAGSEDSAVSPGLLKDLSSKIPGARYVRMEGAGHLPPMHKAEEFERIALGFLEG